jgi:hypothetical protein
MDAKWAQMMAASVIWASGMFFIAHLFSLLTNTFSFLGTFLLIMSLPNHSDTAHPSNAHLLHNLALTTITMWHPHPACEPLLTGGNGGVGFIVNINANWDDR